MLIPVLFIRDELVERSVNAARCHQVAGAKSRKFGKTKQPGLLRDPAVVDCFNAANGRRTYPRNSSGLIVHTAHAAHSTHAAAGHATAAAFFLFRRFGDNCFRGEQEA
jgi:hypothetical protein